MVYNEQKLGDDEIMLFLFYIIVELTSYQQETRFALKMIKVF